jgi:hypothetical protein
MWPREIDCLRGYDTRLHRSECPHHALRLNPASRIVGLRSCLELSLAELEGIRDEV